MPRAPLIAIAALLVLAGAAGCSDTVPPPGATLSGFVYLDTNANGLRDSCDGGAIPSTVRVRLSPQSGAGPTYDATTSAGEWRIAEVAEGDYVLRLLDPLQGQHWMTTFPSVDSGEPRYELEVKGYGSIEDLDFGVANAEPVTVSSGFQVLRTIFFEDADGSGSLDPGECALDFTKGWFVPDTYLLHDGPDREEFGWLAGAVMDNVDGYWRHTTGAGGDCTVLPEPLATGKQEIVIRHVGLQRATGTASIQIRSFEDSDRDGSMDPGEAAIPGSNASVWPDPLGCLLSGVVVDSSDTGRVEQLPAGIWLVNARVDGCHDRTDCDLVTITRTTEESAPIALSDGEVAVIDIGYEITEVGELVARVIEDTNGNGLADPGEPGAHGAEVCHVQGEFLDEGVNPVCQRTATSGVVRFRAPGGTVTVFINPLPNPGDRFVWSTADPPNTVVMVPGQTTTADFVAQRNELPPPSSNEGGETGVSWPGEP